MSNKLLLEEILKKIINYKQINYDEFNIEKFRNWITYEENQDVNQEIFNPKITTNIGIISREDLELIKTEIINILRYYRHIQLGTGILNKMKNEIWSKRISEEFPIFFKNSIQDLNIYLNNLDTRTVYFDMTLDNPQVENFNPGSYNLLAEKINTPSNYNSLDSYEHKPSKNPTYRQPQHEPDVVTSDLGPRPGPWHELNKYEIKERRAFKDTTVYNATPELTEKAQLKYMYDENPKDVFTMDSNYWKDPNSKERKTGLDWTSLEPVQIKQKYLKYKLKYNNLKNK